MKVINGSKIGKCEICGKIAVLDKGFGNKWACEKCYYEIGNEKIEKETKCGYCSHSSDDHPTKSFPLGSFTCLNGCGCYLIKSHVEKLFGSGGK
jgi:hypothetical protein